MAIFAPSKMRMVMDVDGIKFHQNGFQVTQLKERTKEPTPFKQNNIDIVSPIPLEDLQTIVDSMNKYKKHREMPSRFDTLGKGHFGIVFGYKDYAIKFVSGGQSAYNDYGNFQKNGEIQDALILRKLQDIPAIPKLYSIIDNEIIIMERIHGMTMRQYQDQMEDIDKMDNFINVNFVNAHKEIMKDILMAGILPVDLHMENVMVCEKTGLPRVIDVGLFTEMDEGQLKMRGDDRDNILFPEFHTAQSAVSYAKRLRQYIDEKRFPQLLEERKADIIERQQEEERYLEKRKAQKAERMKREEIAYEERKEERRKQRRENNGLAQIYIKEGRFGVVDADFKGHREPLDFGRFANGHMHVIPNLVPFNMNWGAMPVAMPMGWGQHIEPVRERPQNAHEWMIMKKDNQFKKGLHNMFKSKREAILQNNHKNKFAM